MEDKQGVVLIVGTEGALVERLVSGLRESGRTVETILAPACDTNVEREHEVAVPDPRAMDFGLSGPEYESLLRRTRCVIWVVQPEEDLPTDVEQSCLVRSAAEVLEFVRSSGAPEGVIGLSSLLVFGSSSGEAREEELSKGQSFGGVLEESWAVAERVLRHASSLVPVRIVRTAPIVGDSERGELLRGSGLEEIVRRIEMAPPVSEVSFRDLPVYFETAERASAAISRLVTHHESITMHLVDVEPPTDRELLSWLGERLGRSFRESVPGSRTWSRARLLEDLESPTRRAFSGWALQFSRNTALALCSDLLDRSWQEPLEHWFPERPLRAREESRE